MFKSLALALAAVFVMSGAAQAQENGRRGRGATAPSAEQVMAEATAATAVVAPACRVSAASALGARPDGVKLYEVACDRGPGYVIEADAAAPKAHDCVMQWSYAQAARAADPAADVGLQCALPGNQNPVGVITAYGTEAGVACTVDEALATGVDVYEIGCADRDGWRLRREADAWVATPCWELALRSSTGCRFSGRDEARVEWAKLVVGTDAADCEIQDVAWMGANAERGAFYEVKCASGRGLVVRFKNGAGQQTYACADAQQVFGRPCRLTAEGAGVASGGRP